MAAPSLSDEIQAHLNQIHSATEIGRMLELPGSRNIREATPEVVQFLLLEATALEAVVVRLAAEVDKLRAI